MNDFWPNPWESQTGMPRDWDDFYSNQQAGAWGSFLGFNPFRDPLAEARAFYGEEVLQSLLEAQRLQNEQLRIRAQRLPEMVDDVAGQWVKR